MVFWHSGLWPTRLRCYCAAVTSGLSVVTVTMISALQDKAFSEFTVGSSLDSCKLSSFTQARFCPIIVQYMAGRFAFIRQVP